MNLSEPFIRRPVMTSLAMFAILIVGCICFIKLPISSMPDVNYPTINVKLGLPGGLPETMSNAVALPLEKQFMSISGLRLVSSNSTQGNTSIVLQFEIDKDMETAAQDVQEAITSAIPYLPVNLPYGPVYRKFNPAEQPIIYISLTSKTLPRGDLYTYANTIIGQRISMIEGVSQVSTYGTIRAVRIQVDPAQVQAHDLTLDEIAAAINLENTFLPTGQLDGITEAPIISVNGQLVSAEEYESLVVAYRNGSPVRIQDLGRAVNSFQDNKIFSQYVDDNGAQPCVTIAIQKSPGGNTVAIADEIYRILGELKGELPPAIDLHIVFDRSVPVRYAIYDAYFTLIAALLLVVLVIFLFLGKVADTIIPSIVMPLSVVGTFIVMYLFDFTLDNLSVLALTLAIGIIIDDAIVVLENISRLIEEGKPPFEAALEGSKQISFTIISMTLSLIAVFIPMLFMGGLIGKIFREFAITLTVITLISGFISLTLTPMLAGRFLPMRKTNENNHEPVSYSSKINKKMQMAYYRVLVAVIDYKWAALIIGVLSLIATIGLLKLIPTDFLPNEDMGFFIVYTQEREGGSSSKMLTYENELIELLFQNPAVDKVVAISSLNEYRKGLNLVHLKPMDERAPIQEVIQETYKQMKDIEGMQGFIKNIPLIDLSTGQQSGGAYQFALQSIYADKLYASARRVLDKMQKNPIFQGVNSNLEIDTPRIDIVINREKASTLGITATDIENAFNFGYSGNLVSRIQTDVDQYNVILEIFPELQQNTDALNNIWLRSTNSKQLVPLSALVDWSEKLGATSINHIDQFPSVIISFNLAPNVPLEAALNTLASYSEEIIDPGVSAQSIGAAQTFQESIRTSGYLLIITVICIYIILGILYESFLHPLTILTTLPPAMCGGLLALVALGLPLSLYSFLGIVLLIGIVKKNGIMMVDFALENVRQKGMNVREATLNACLVRFRPIMMTTIAAIFGILPIAIGLGSNASARRPLGLVVIGGLLLSQLITLFVTPILYLEMERLHEKLTRRVK